MAQSGFDDEPGAYAAPDDALLELGDVAWATAWAQHVLYRDNMLRRCNHGRREFSAFNPCAATYAAERHIEAAHAKMRSIMLERRVRTLEKMFQRLETEVRYAPGGRGAEAARVEFVDLAAQLSGGTSKQGQV